MKKDLKKVDVVPFLQTLFLAIPESEQCASLLFLPIQSGIWSKDFYWMQIRKGRLENNRVGYSGLSIKQQHVGFPIMKKGGNGMRT
jgi:hypothetical protein